MRTTLNLDDDVMQAARSMAAAQGRTVGQVISALVRKALRPVPAARRSGFPMFDVPEDAAPITPEMVREAMDEA